MICRMIHLMCIILNITRLHSDTHTPYAELQSPISEYECANIVFCMVIWKTKLAITVGILCFITLYSNCSVMFGFLSLDSCYISVFNPTCPLTRFVRFGFKRYSIHSMRS